MKNKILAITAGLLTAMALTACGKDPELTQFREEIDAFCTEISDIDTSINNVDAESDNAADELLGYLDQLDQDFRISPHWIFLRNLIIWKVWPMKPVNI